MVRKRIHQNYHMPVEERGYKGAFSCAKKMLEAEGSGVFFRGSLSNSPSQIGSALTLVFYDEIKKRVSIPQKGESAYTFWRIYLFWLWYHDSMSNIIIVFTIKLVWYIKLLLIIPFNKDGLALLENDVRQWDVLPRRGWYECRHPRTPYRPDGAQYGGFWSAARTDADPKRSPGNSQWQLQGRRDMMMGQARLNMGMMLGNYDISMGNYQLQRGALEMNYGRGYGYFWFLGSAGDWFKAISQIITYWLEDAKKEFCLMLSDISTAYFFSRHLTITLLANRRYSYRFWGFSHLLFQIYHESNGRRSV